MAEWNWRLFFHPLAAISWKHSCSLQQNLGISLNAIWPSYTSMTLWLHHVQSLAAVDSCMHGPSPFSPGPVADFGRWHIFHHISFPRATSHCSPAYSCDQNSELRSCLSSACHFQEISSGGISSSSPASSGASSAPYTCGFSCLHGETEQNRAIDQPRVAPVTRAPVAKRSTTWSKSSILWGGTTIASKLAKQ